jgi:LPS export ABC transporter protein LptC
MRIHQMSNKIQSPAGTTLLLVIFFPISLFLSSCENDLEVIKAITKTSNFPTLTRDNTEIVYTDSARIRVRITTPRLERFSNSNEPYLEFPSGMFVQFYNDSNRVESTIRSKYAQYDEKKQLWKAQNDVIAVNLRKGEQLNTEELFWDEKTQRIYSEKFSRVTTSSGVFYGEEGLEADQTFSWYKLKGIRGNVNWKADEE